MWGPLQGIHIKCRTLVTIALFTVIISINFITTLGTAVHSILLLPASEVEMQEKMKLFWQAGDYFRMWLASARVGIVVLGLYSSPQTLTNFLFKNVYVTMVGKNIEVHGAWITHAPKQNSPSGSQYHPLHKSRVPPPSSIKKGGETVWSRS